MSSTPNSRATGGPISENGRGMYKRMSVVSKAATLGGLFPEFMSPHSPSPFLSYLYSLNTFFSKINIISFLQLAYSSKKHDDYKYRLAQLPWFLLRPLSIYLLLLSIVGTNVNPVRKVK